MTEILIYDHWDDWGWYYYCIGSGNLTADKIVSQITDAKDDDILVRINSVGGSVFDGFAIYNALKQHPKKVTVQVDALAASIASIIAMAGEEIIICQAAMMMVHKPTIDPFWFGRMDESQLQREAEALRQVEAVLNDIYVTKTGLDNETVQQMINAETWLTPDTAVSLGFANRIEKTVKEQPIPENAFKQIFKNAQPQVKAFANKVFNQIEIMDPKTKEQLDENKKLIQNVSKQLDGHKSLLDKALDAIKNMIGGKAKDEAVTLEDGGTIYTDGALAKGVKVFTDEDMTEAAPDKDWALNDGRTITTAGGEVTEIEEASDDVEDKVDGDVTDEAEIKELRNQNKELANQLKAAQDQLKKNEKILNKLAGIKSNYSPEDRDQNFRSQDEDGKEKAKGFDRTDMEDRKKSYKTKKNSR